MFDREELIEAIVEAKKVIHLKDLPDARKPPKLNYYRNLAKQTQTSSGLLHHYRPMAKQAQSLREGVLKRMAFFVKKDATDTFHNLRDRAKDIAKPIGRYKRAAAYRERGKQLIAHGRFDRGLTMQNRGSRVMARYAPEVVGTGIGVGLGATAGFAIPGSTEIGAVGGQKVARAVSRMVGRRRARK